jgi:hypothetical protein
MKPVDVDAQRLRGRIRQARIVTQAWLADVARHADPVRWDSAGELLFRRKCFNELAGFLLWHERLPHRQDDAVAAIGHFVASRIDDNYLSMALRRPERLLMYTAALGYAVHAGLFDQRQCAVVRATLAGPFAWSLDHTVFRQLDQVLACHFAGVKAPLDPAALFRVCALALPPSPIYGNRDAFYAVTHSAFYRFFLADCAVDAHPMLALSVKGGVCRALASNDFDLGLELVMVQLLHGIALGPESLMLVEQLLDEILAEGQTAARQRSMDVVAFLEVEPGEAAWAERFHLMLVASLTLLLLEEQADPDWRMPDQLACEGARAMGSCLLALHRYHLASGLAHLERLDAAVPLDPGLLREIAAFVRLNERADGHFGHLVDEAARLAKLDPDGDAGALIEPVDRACHAFLQRYPDRGSPGGQAPAGLLPPQFYR